MVAGVGGVLAAWAFDTMTIRLVVAGRWRRMVGYDV